MQSSEDAKQVVPELVRWLGSTQEAPGSRGWRVPGRCVLRARSHWSEKEKAPAELEEGQPGRRS